MTSQQWPLRYNDRGMPPYIYTKHRVVRHGWNTILPVLPLGIDVVARTQLIHGVSYRVDNNKATTILVAISVPISNSRSQVAYD